MLFFRKNGVTIVSPTAPQIIADYEASDWQSIGSV